MNNIFIYSAGNGSRDVLRLIYGINQEKPIWNVLGFVDRDPDLIDQHVDGYQVFSPDKLPECGASYGITGVTNPNLREKIIEEEIKSTGKTLATLIHPTAIMSSDLILGNGSIVFPGVHISFSVKFGEGVIICFNSDIGHHVNLGKYASVMPSVTINGKCNIGDNCIVGSGAIIHEGVTIARQSTVGIGTIVTRDIEENSSVIDFPKKITMRKSSGKHYGRSKGENR